MEKKGHFLESGIDYFKSFKVQESGESTSAERLTPYPIALAMKTCLVTVTQGAKRLDHKGRGPYHSLEDLNWFDARG